MSGAKKNSALKEDKEDVMPSQPHFPGHFDLKLNNESMLKTQTAFPSNLPTQQ